MQGSTSGTSDASVDIAKQTLQAEATDGTCFPQKVHIFVKRRASNLFTSDLLGKCVDKSHIKNWRYIPLEAATTYEHRRACLQHCETKGLTVAALKWGQDCFCGSHHAASR